MNELALIVRDICQLKRGPQDLPYWPTGLILLLVASIVVDWCIALLTASEQPYILVRSLFSNVFALVILYILLSLRSLQTRFVQTAIALVACGIVFSLLVLPIALASGKMPATPQQLSPLQMLLAWVTFAIIVWKFTVDGHILRHALNIPFAAGLTIAVVWAIADLSLARLFLGAAP